MPRANRHFVSGHVWHITHRCHKKEFLLKFSRDRKRWLYWLFESKKRYGLTILNYIVTSNHVHLLVHDNGQGEISKSMQLVAGRTAQEYNKRKNRNGAYWEDRYHATAIDTHKYLIQCLIYIDLNMVRAGKVNHPEQWGCSGYNEIQKPPNRYRLIDLERLCLLCGVSDIDVLRAEHKKWIEQAFTLNQLNREEHWSGGLAVGESAYINTIKDEIGLSAKHKQVNEVEGRFELRESRSSYNVDFYDKNIVLSVKGRGC